MFDRSAQAAGAARQSPSRAAGSARPADAILALQRTVGNAAVARHLAPRVQRNIGVELEDREWTSDADPSGEPLKKYTPLIHRPFFQLQAEDDGDRSSIEMVTTAPGVVNRGEWDAMLSAIDVLSGELDRLRPGEIWRTARFTGGETGYRIAPPSSRQGFQPHLQITAGVPLASIPALFRHLNGKATVFGSPSGMVPQEARRWKRGLSGEPASPELMGFATMLESYLIHGRHAGPAASTPILKGLTTVLARTDFAKLFELLPGPEQSLIRGNLASWIDAITGTQSAAPVFPHRITQLESLKSGQLRVRTTRANWLEEMTNGRDLLSYRGILKGAGKSDVEAASRLAGTLEYVDDALPRHRTAKKAYTPGPSTETFADRQHVIQLAKEVYESLGALGSRTDTVRYHQPGGPIASRAPAVIVEIRQPSGSDLRKAMADIYTAVDMAIRKPFPDGPEYDHSNVLTRDGMERRSAAVTASIVATVKRLGPLLPESGGNFPG